MINSRYIGLTNVLKAGRSIFPDRASGPGFLPPLGLPNRMGLAMAGR